MKSEPIILLITHGDSMSLRVAILEMKDSTLRLRAIQTAVIQHVQLTIEAGQGF